MRLRDVTLNEFNVIANDPSVLAAINPFVNRIDLAWIYEKPGVMVKGVDGIQGCALLIPWEGNAIEAHWFFPGFGGIKAIRAIRDWIFENTNTNAVFGIVPEQNIGARIVNRALGAKEIGRLVDDHGRPALTMACSRDEWISHKAPKLDHTN